MNVALADPPPKLQTAMPLGSRVKPVASHASASPCQTPRTLNMLYARKIAQHFLTKDPTLAHVLSQEQKVFAHHRDLDARCTLQEWHDLLAACTRHATHIDPVPELSARLKPWCLGLLGPLFMSATTVGGLLQLLEQVHPLLNDVFVVEHGVQGDRAFFRLRQTSHERSDALARLSLLMGRQLMCFFTNRMELVADASFEGPPPVDPASYRRALGGTVRFDQGENALFFDASYLSIPFAYKDDSLHQLLKSEAIQLMEISTRNDDPFIDRLRSHVRAHLESGADQKIVALSMNLTTRGLQRRMLDTGINFRDMVKEEKTREAIRCLCHTDMPVIKIAAAVGFADPSIFSRAFRQWTGMTPRDYRAAHQK